MKAARVLVRAVPVFRRLLHLVLQHRSATSVGPSTRVKTKPWLFRLPRELRDEIYKYALHQPEGIVCRFDSGGTGRCYRRTKDASRSGRIFRRLHRITSYTYVERWCEGHNQLKLVCQRLYRETRGLELLENCIIMEDSPTFHALDQCLTLFRSCQIFQAVRIKCCSSFFVSALGQERLLRIIEHVSTHKAITARVHIPQWTMKDPDFVFRGLSYLFTLRMDSHPLRDLARVTSVTYISSSAAEVLNFGIAIPTNLRFHPREEDFEPTVLEQVFRKRPLLELPIVQAMLGDVRLLAKKWHEEGL